MQHDGNVMWPLPADYELLTKEGQREARLAVLMRQETPDDFVTAWEFFRSVYLLNTEPGFFYKEYSPSPPFHYEMVRDIASYARNATAAPRGFAKSTLIGKEIPLLLMLTRPHFHIAMGLATDKLVEKRLEELDVQLTENPNIIEDFGALKMPRSKGMWNHHFMKTRLGSICEGFSIMGAKRGARPNLFILDDPENDPETDSVASSSNVMAKFETVMFRQIIPMLTKGSGIYWIGTMINRRCFLYHACSSDDKRFASWNRKIYSALSGGVTLWDGKWDTEYLKQREADIGSSAFAAEYMNNPVSEQDRVFVVDPVRNEYTAEGWNPSEPRPLSSECKVEWSERNQDGSWGVKAEKAGKLFSGMFRMVLMDIAHGVTEHHDYSCIVIAGYDKSNCLWVLDIWAGRVKEPQLISKAYEMGYKWNARVVGIETMSAQKRFVDSMDTYLMEHTIEGWVPRVVPIDYQRQRAAGGRNASYAAKGDRIAGLEWRFGAGKIKYPKHLEEVGSWPMLYAQTRDFTRDLAMLRFDDAIDTVAMSQYVVHNKGVEMQEAAPELSMAQRIAKDTPMMDGMPVLSGVGSQDIIGELAQALLDKMFKARYDNKSRTVNVRRPRVVAGLHERR